MTENQKRTDILIQGVRLQDRYEIIEVIGKGGFGITYLAKDLRVDVPVAVKEYRSERQLSEEDAVRETKMAAKFYDLDGIAAARDCFVENNHIYIVMEYVKGCSIKQYLKLHGRFSGQEILPKLRPIIKSLGKIHAEGVIHRDISADNLMITDDGKFMLIDFGTARFTREDPNKPYTLIFKRGFAPIEQCRVHGRQGPWTDIYSLCATIYYMITGMIPEDAVERILEDHLQSLELIQGTGLTGQEAACIMKGLEVQPEKRFSEVSELYEALYEQKWEGKIQEKEENEETGKNEVFHPTTNTGYSTTSLLNDVQEMLKSKRKDKRIRRFAGIAVGVAVPFAFCLILFSKVLFSSDSSRMGGLPTATVPVITPELRKTPKPTHSPETTYSIGSYTGLTKKQVQKRTKTLQKAGLTITFRKRYSSKVKKGCVIAQKPSPGKTYVNLNKVSLKLVISKGAKPTPKPTVRPTAKPTVRPTSAAKEKPSQSNVDFSGNLDQIPD